MVEDKDLDAAMAVLCEPGKDDDLPQDFESPHEPEEKVENDGVALALLLFLLLIIVLPLIALAIRRQNVVTPEEAERAFMMTLLLAAVIVIALFGKFRNTDGESAPPPLK